MQPAPSAAKMITESGIDSSTVQGSGKRGQVLKEDVIKAASSAPVEVNVKAPQPEGEREERVRMTRLRQTIAKRLKDAQNTAAMLYHL